MKIFHLNDYNHVVHRFTIFIEFLNILSKSTTFHAESRPSLRNIVTVTQEKGTDGAAI